MKLLNKLLVSAAFAGLFATSNFAAEETSKFVAISKGVKSIDMNLNGEKFTIMRNQTAGNKISSLYDTTFRGAPQPISLAKGLETLGELEFIEYMKKAQTDENIAIIDSRKPGWFDRLRIPGAVNVPFTNFDEKDTAIEMMEDEMGVVQNDDGTLDFSNAKTLALYCNGYWCGQTPGMVKNAKFALLKMGYPVEKIKYYRGGMQAWTSLGFTVVGSGK
ncbi:rhodanese-like domain-containing protein [Poseidonibacter ostreae]|jgi:rhodanese-related sulfurtransferase|uniref:Sulfurtransferase n=1 Tax=Poseidonibacter ostreae TaxID=2654171 RepID=A0A6L4WVD4_9BACT|nr:rhodanese-like domain-containing protein [Poseidonibacter ostreae]KAB7886283.1 sulfurtransferase [Poseidonibacter ostreae]KAB7888886.1 sulfurtransferase [Poseidonibacter ostreae]KAB7890053.1 sulfurtransferase [Poseidonibacter ostreae]MAC84586.1 sulfurtransferase [Arcobacter sp.]